MCYTYSDDFGLIKEGSHNFSTGVTKSEQEYIMAQIFDNDIAPYMEFKK